MKELIKILSLRYIDIDIDRGQIIIDPLEQLTLMEQAAIDFHRIGFRDWVNYYHFTSVILATQIIHRLQEETS